jgi:hypothetical protein
VEQLVAHDRKVRLFLRSRGDHVEVAEAISAVIGRVVEFHPISQQDWQRGLEGIADGSTGVVNTAMAQHISAVGAQLAQRAGAAIVPNPLRLAEITGRGTSIVRRFRPRARKAFIPAGTS